ncbi:hypothetical protein H7142_01730 [Candidatus Saccharibacteria bacterium]|nr:hypothetical protein [Candidatus Saccharibacteria bacterium]
MIIVWALSWWYGAGWKARLLLTYERLLVTYDYFSIGLLAKTLFAPYRQISAGSVDGPIGLKLRAFADRQISRMIGAVVRSTLIVAGAVWLFVQVILGLLALGSWALVPIAPFVGFVLMLSGWVPSWN